MKSGAYEINGTAFGLTSPMVHSGMPQSIQSYKEWISHLEQRSRLMDKLRPTTQDETLDFQPKRRLRRSERIVAISSSKLNA
ncbi:MAG: hypothetical protein K2X93_02605 [Candidatus Obscuribacterales bacterium]|nr:hypothetical protein [Candidatus Obscuribacterales bacterium]